MFLKENKNLRKMFNVTDYAALIGKIRHGIGKKGGYFLLGMGPKFGP